MYDDGPVSLHDFLSNRYNVTHEELFQNAYSKWKREYLIGTILEDDTSFMYDWTLYYNDTLNIQGVVVDIANKCGGDTSQKLLSDVTDIISRKMDYMYNHIKNKNLVHLSDIAHVSNIKITTDDSDIKNLVQWKFKESNKDDIKFFFGSNGQLTVVLSDTKDFFYLTDKIADMKERETLPIITSTYNNISYAFDNTHKTIEDKASEYWRPSTVVVMSLYRPYTKLVVPLEDYWIKVTLSEKESDILSKLKLTDADLTNARLIYIDYVNGVAKMELMDGSREFDVPFKYLNDETEISDDYKLDMLFSSNKNKL